MERMELPRVFAIWHPDDSIRMASSSGGAFTLFAEDVIRRGGVVFGAAWDSEMRVVIKHVETEAGLSELRESKYVAATPGNEYVRAREYLEGGREVFYCGTPCQIAGLKSFLRGKVYENLFTADFICHGAPDRRVWGKYTKWLERQYGGKIEEVHFRDKRWGTESNLLLVVRFQNVAKPVVIASRENTYYYGFIHNFFLRPCCLRCGFNKVPRVADVSFADFRGLGEHDSFDLERDKVKGFTGVIVNTNQGRRLIARVNHESVVERRFEELANSQPLLRESPRPHEKAAEFWRDFDSMDWPELAQRYLRPSYKYVAYILARRTLGPRLFLRLGIVYKKLTGKRSASWRI